MFNPKLVSTYSVGPYSTKVLVKTHPMFGDETREYLINMEEQEFLDAYRDWANGMLIQNAFPNLSANEREFLLSGIIGDEEWEKYASNL